jgi:ubiquinone/menaquinone biosynthesis C-methylase UbiE
VSATNTFDETPDIETASDDYAARFAGEAGRYFLGMQAAAVRHVLERLAFESVLDVGGGHGQLVPIFLERGCALTILGSNDDTHRRVRESFPGAGIQFATGSVLRLPFPDQSFDVVIAVRLISHIEAWPTLLAEFCRVARRSVIIDYASWLSPNALTPLLFMLKKSLEGNTRTYRTFFRSELRRTFREHGFDVVGERKQFFLPMLMHRAAKGSRALQFCEAGCRALGLTALLGSPVIMRADRVERASGAPR